jgi:hypothetical protein
MTFKVLIVVTIISLAAWPLLRMRWPEIARRINLALIAALIAVVLFRLIAWFNAS